MWHFADPLLELRAQFGEPCFGVLNCVYLVDRNNIGTHSHEPTYCSVTQGLSPDSANCIDNQQRDVSEGCGHCHVARVLLVPWRVGE
jgi:hypothetical protein